MDNPEMNRRLFLGQAGAFVIAGAAARALPAQGEERPNPFAYDLSRVSRTDPKLVLFEETTRFACPQPEPRRITLGVDGNLYIAAGNQVSVMDRSGRLLRSLELEHPASCVAVADNGQVFVGARNQVEVFDKDGRREQAWEAAGQKSWYTALALGDDDLFVADAGERVVLRLDRQGKLRNRIGAKDSARSIPGLVVPSPYLDVELAPDGLLRVNNPGRHRVEIYTRDGELELTWGSAGGGIAGFTGCCNPISVALLPGGGYVTCEKGLPRVKVYSEAGAFEGVVAGVESFPENMRAGSARRTNDGMMGGLDAAVDAEGRVYILDLVANNVRVMTRKA